MLFKKTKPKIVFNLEVLLGKVSIDEHVILSYCESKPNLAFNSFISFRGPTMSNVEISTIALHP
jgi:hypothetical protein